ncbi:MAG: GAF domain-containing protein [Myxococcota bacterium]|nr:GAF domain-containing protein [Myxococcota bacterium]
MALFRVLVPAVNPTGIDFIKHIEGETWLDALKVAIKKLGALVDIQHLECVNSDIGLEIQDPQGGRTFYIQCLSTDADSMNPFLPEIKPETPKAPQTSFEEETRTHSRQTHDSIGHLPKIDAQAKTTEINLQQLKASPSAPEIATEATAPGHWKRLTEESKAPLVTKEKTKGAQNIFNSIYETTEEFTLPSHLIPRHPEDAAENLNLTTTQLFFKTANLHMANDLREAANRTLDLALESIPANAGTIYLVEPSRKNLCFAAVRGPASETLAGKTLGWGQGLAGFATDTGLSLHIRDAQTDPRFRQDIAEKLNYQVQSMLCVPILSDSGNVGCIQLLNALSPHGFQEEARVQLDFLAQQLAQFMSDRQTFALEPSQVDTATVKLSDLHKT